MKSLKNMTSENEPSFWLSLECVQYATEEEQWASTNSSRKNEAARPKQPGQSNNNAQLWMCLLMKVKSEAVKNTNA